MSPPSNPTSRRSVIPDEELAVCLRVLEALRSVPIDDPAWEVVERASSHLQKESKKKRRRARLAERQAFERSLDAQTARVQLQEEEASGAHREATPSGQVGERRGDRRCYVCKEVYRQVDAFYHRLCPSCAERHRLKRHQRVDLGGRRALVTGGRIKIGFELALKLLRDGAEVVVTTRFPADAARRYAACEDAARWRDRLQVVGLDLRFLPDVLRFIEGMLAGPPLDILVNNAAQTVRRPAAWYAALARAEGEGLPELASGWVVDIAGRAQVPGAEAWLSRGGAEALAAFHAVAASTAPSSYFPLDGLDEEGKPRDLRPRNSWRELLAEVEPVELVETQVVNAIAPFLLTGRLKPLLLRASHADRYVVHASAVEGQFAWANKTDRHPHTNMAKAALNMLTRTSAADYARDGIYMNSVDTGWITEENPEPVKQAKRDAGFCPPLDVIDGAARLYDPIVRGVQGEPVHGMFFKDYEPAPW